MIYLDFNAGAPLNPEVAEEITRVWQHWANPGSVQHRSGAEASNFLTSARSQLAKLLGQSAAEVIFTSGATEAASIAILGLCLSAYPGKQDIALLRTEHKAVISAAQVATQIVGSKLHFIDVDRNGIALEESLKATLNDEVCVFACMLVNNETGVIQDLESAINLCKKFGIELICDVTQAIGKANIPEGIRECTYFFSGHKLGTPKGVGCLILPRRLQANFISVIPGGGQERGIRGGTENPAMASGLSMAVGIALSKQSSFADKAASAAGTFVARLNELGVEFETVAQGAPRALNTVNLHFPGVDGDAILANLRLVEASTGSACNSANPEPSHVLLAMSYSFEEASSCVRFSFGDSHSLVEIEQAAQDVCQAVIRVKNFEDGVA